MAKKRFTVTRSLSLVVDRPHEYLDPPAGRPFRGEVALHDGLHGRPAVGGHHGHAQVDAALTQVQALGGNNVSLYSAGLFIRSGLNFC